MRPYSPPGPPWRALGVEAGAFPASDEDTMLTGSQMIVEAVRRIGTGEDSEAVLRDIFGPVLDAAAYAARKSRRLDEGEGDASDLISACEGCADVIADDEE